MKCKIFTTDYGVSPSQKEINKWLDKARKVDTDIRFIITDKSKLYIFYIPHNDNKEIEWYYH